MEIMKTNLNEQYVVELGARGVGGMLVDGLDLKSLLAGLSDEKSYIYRKCLFLCFGEKTR